MLPLERNGYTRSQVMEALHGKYASRNLDFRYELLDSNNVKKSDLYTVVSGEVSLRSLAQIKRTATFRIKDDSTINWLSDRIKPYCIVRMPDGGQVEFPLGVFLLSTPVRSDENGHVYRDVEAYDGLVILLDDKFESRYIISEGTSYFQAVKAILNSAGIDRINLQDTGAVLPKNMEFEPGREKLFAINELLRQINFNQIHVDVEGFFTSFPYRSPSLRGAEYTYKDDTLSVTYNGMEEEFDLFNVANKWVVVRTNAEEEPLVSSYTNSNPNNPTSTVNRKRNIVDFREIENIADQAALDAYTQRIAFEASQIYGKIAFETAIMPFHDYADVLQIEYSPLGIKDKFSETSWSFPLTAGGRMKHECRRVVTI